MNRHWPLFVLALSALAAGCRSSKKEGPPPPRVDWGASDVATVSTEMVDDLLDSPELSRLIAGAGDDLRVAAFAAGLTNETNRPVDAAGFMAAVERLLLASGRFRLVEPEAPDTPAQGPRSATPPADAARARELAAELGAELALRGVLRSRKLSAEEGGGRKFFLELACFDVAREEPLWTAVREVSPDEGDLFVSR